MDDSWMFADWNVLPEQDTGVYKYACWYMAQTEIYDRLLTHRRSEHDPTEAFLVGSLQRLNSNEYALWLRRLLGRGWIRVQEEIKRHRNYSAQKWIDEYERITRNEMRAANGNNQSE